MSEWKLEIVIPFILGKFESQGLNLQVNSIAKIFGGSVKFVSCFVFIYLT